MTPERWERVQEWFDRLANLPLEKRRHELDKLDASDPELRREVEARLGSGDRSADFIRQAVGSASGQSQSLSEGRRDRVGQTIAHYRIEQRLGGGGMGVVYRAQDLRLDRAVALKFLPPATDDEDERIKRLILEARAASALDHPNICTIHQIDRTDDGHWFIVMAYYNGETLKKRIERGPLPVSDVLDFGTQIMSGLVKAHREGIVHRDLKPANLMVTNDGVIKIVDFGLAQLREQTKLTAPGTRLGTPAYMSPEQAQGQPLDHRTDIWSLGVVLYEMLAGRAPFKGEYELAVIYSIVNEEPPSLEQLRPDTPSALLKIVKKGLSKDPADRHQQVEELLHEVERLKGSQPVVAGPPPPVATPSPRGPRFVYVWLAAAAAVIIAVLLGMMALTRPGDTGQPDEQPPTVSELSIPEPPALEPSAPDAPAPNAVPGASGPLGAQPGSAATTAGQPPASVPETVTPTRPAPAAATVPPPAVAEAPAARPAATVRSWPAESQRWALIIGIEQYNDAGIPAFRGAARDAAAIEQALVRYAGFPQDQVVMLSSSESAQLRSPTRANIESYLENVTRLVPREGLLLFCFVGHAAMADGQPALLPMDARLSRGAIPLSSAVRLESVRAAVKRRGIRQVVVLFDGFRQDPRTARQGAANPMSEAYARRLFLDPAAREVDAFAALYAASPDERGYESSSGSGYFAAALVEGLRGSAADARGRLTLNGLERYVRTVAPKRVMSELGARAVQRPFSQIEGYVSDEVVIATNARREVTTSEPAAAPPQQPQQQPPPVDPAVQELADWTRIRDSRDVAAFELFLRNHANGALRKEAQSKIEDLQWEAARAVNEPAAIKRYLREHAGSRYAGQARARLEELRPPPPPVTAPTPAPVAKVEPPRAPPEADAIRAVLKRYGEAYRARDAQQVAALWPSLSPDQVRRLADSFRVAVSVQQDLVPLTEPAISGDQAMVRCRRLIRYEDERGPQRPVDNEVNVVLRKQQGAWVIQDVN
jgi:serine/threonine protein kinase/ketosteroid isomerase-like protein